jgi:polyisoprenoid-binding protein YceI
LAVAAALSGARELRADGATTWNVDPVHSTVLFRIKHVGASWTWGRFNNVTGTFTIDDAAPSKSSISIKIDAASVDTGNAARDKHLRTADFLNTEQFGDLTFKSTSIAAKADGFTATGDLTLHGRTKSVSFDFKKVGTGEMKGTKLVGYEGELDILRSDFGMSNMVGPVGDDVHLVFAVEGHDK